MWTSDKGEQARILDLDLVHAIQDELNEAMRLISGCRTNGVTRRAVVAR
jgi:hypothetical protein